MDRLPGDLVERISLILGDIKVFYAILNSVPQLIRQRNIHKRAVERFTRKISEQNGSIKRWVLNGRLHRENDLPAYINSIGTKMWFYNGKRYRENDLPTYISPNGTQQWLVGEATLHRENGLPAVIYADGRKEYWFKGVKHN